MADFGLWKDIFFVIVDTVAIIYLLKGSQSRIMKKRNILMAFLTLNILLCLNWDWTNIKSFISGAVIAMWLTRYYYEKS